MKPNNSYDSASRYAYELSLVTILDVETERKLFKRYKRNKDPEAKRRLIESGLRFCCKVAKNYAGQNFDLQQLLVSAGNEGILVALDRYDPNKGTRFLSYAAWWILLYVREELHKNSVVTIQLGRKKALRKLNNTLQKSRKELNREPTSKELSKATGMSIKQVERLLAEHVEVCSLDALTHAPANDEDIAKSTTNKSASEYIEYIISMLPLREAFVIRAYFGQISDPPLSLKAVAAVLGISSERVRQIKLRTLAQIKKYLEYNGVYSLSDLLDTD
jgi:RNA polymerase primary sigma factor